MNFTSSSEKRYSTVSSAGAMNVTDRTPPVCGSVTVPDALPPVAFMPPWQPAQLKPPSAVGANSWLPQLAKQFVQPLERVLWADSAPARIVTFGLRDFHQLLKAKFGLADR